MLASEFLASVRRRIYDVDSIEYSDEELLSYLNDAIAAVTFELIKAEDSEVIAETTFTVPETTKPSNFIKFAGRYPITVIGSAIKVYGDVPIIVRYFKKPDLLVTVDQALPFSNEMINQLLLQKVSLAALNRNEYDISQDKALADEVQRILASS